MNQIYGLKSKLIVFSLFISLVYVLSMFSSDLNSLKSENVQLNQQITDMHKIFEHVIEVPDKIIFCGQEIEIKDSYTRERLQRELINLSFYKNQLELYKRRAKYFFPMIEYYLKSNNLPDDLKYLAVHESALNAKARSRANAVGLWQFMTYTARDFDLKISHYIDERKHPIKSSVAACKYLLKLHKSFQDWPLAIAAYNAGATRVRKAMNKQGEQSFFALALPEETERYFFQIVATSIVLSSYEDEIKTDSEEWQLQPVEFVVENDLVDIKEVCQEYNIPYRTFFNFNPQFRNHMIPYGRHILMIPKNHITPKEQQDLYYVSSKIRRSADK